MYNVGLVVGGLIGWLLLHIAGVELIVRRERRWHRKLYIDAYTRMASRYSEVTERLRKMPSSDTQGHE